MGGVYAVSLVVSICAGTLACAIPRLADGKALAAGRMLLIPLVIGGLAFASGRVEWTAPTGAPIKVSLLWSSSRAFSGRTGWCC